MNIESARTALRSRITLVWFTLVVATLVSWLATDHHRSESPLAVAALAIAILKVRWVGLDFMELREALGPLRWAFEGYCAALFALLVGMYLYA